MRRVVCKRLRKISERPESQQHPLLSNYKMLKRMYKTFNHRDKRAFTQNQEVFLAWAGEQQKAVASPTT